MSLLWMEDWYGTDASAWSLSGDNVWSAARFGSGVALNSRFISSAAKRPFPSSGEVFIGYAFYNGNPAANTMCTFYGDAGTTTHMWCRLNSDGTASLMLGASTVLATSTSTTWLRTGWNYFEFRAKLDDTAGVIEFRANGNATPVVTYTGDTKNAGTTTTLDAVQINFATGCLICDIWLVDTTGSVNNTYLGDQKILAIVATGAGSSTGFTPSTGANWSNTDEAPASSTDYNAATVSGTRDTYAMGDLATNNLITAVRHDVYAHKNDTDPTALKTAVKVGSTVYYGPNNTLTTSMTKFELLHQVSPATSAPWTVAEVNAMELGAEVV